MGRPPRGRRPGRPTGPGTSEPAAAEVPGSPGAVRSPAATGCSWRCRRLRQSSQGDAPPRPQLLQPRPDLVQCRRDGACRVRHEAHSTAPSQKRQRLLLAGHGRRTVTDMDAYDVLIIGGGAAGLSAALVLSRARRSVLVVDSGAPRNLPAAQLHGFLSRDGLPPAELLAAGRAEVRGYGGTITAGTVTAVQSLPTAFSVRLADGHRISARRLLVATGLRDELPDIPGSGRAVGTRRAALPVLPRLGGARPAARHSVARTGDRSVCADRPSVVRRRRPGCPSRRRDRGTATAAGRPQHRDHRRGGEPGPGRERPPLVLG